MKALHRAASLALLILLPAVPGLAAIPVSCWDATSEFNDSANPDAANPSGVWSYGWKKTLTDKFFLAQTPYSNPPSIFGWCNASGFPHIIHSSRTAPFTGSGVNAATLPPRALLLHPGLNGEYAILRFTAPADGTYKIAGQFYALDDHGKGTTTDVWVLPNETKTGAYSAEVDYYGGAGSVSFTGKVFQLKKGNTLDFEVGCGPNKNYEYDSTGLAALIEKVK
ncbi:MAG: hypothetical protein H0X40_01010 [Chthoniobacterales bacterium]|nr:hypothetical protein [Chthoniobacterales bacterium]